MDDFMDFLSSRIDATIRDAKLDADPGVRQYVLAECEAKRRIVEMHYDGNGGLYPNSTPFCATCTSSDGLDDPGWPCPTLRFLALPYSHHPDYQQYWCP